MRFTHQTLGQRVTFGAGTAAEDLAQEAERLGARRSLLIATSSAAELAGKLEKSIPVAARIDGVRRHVPVEDAQQARAQAEEAQADLLVAVGGGSAIGLAKAVALTSEVPIVAVPTTYSGSEATNVWGMTENDRKTTGVDDAVLPATVIYDAEAVAGLPAELAVASGLNAVAHAVDALWAPRANPLNRAWAVEAVRALGAGLPQLAASAKAGSEDLEGRQQTQYGAYVSAVAFASAGSALHHKICHVLGGAFDLPHAQTHAVVLPYVVAFNASSAQDSAMRLAEALGAESALEGLMALKAALGAPTALRDHGLREEDLEEAAELVHGAAPESNPRPLGRADAERLVHAAWAGEAPAELLG